MSHQTPFRARAIGPLAAALVAIPLLTAAPAHAGVSAGVNLNILKITGDGFGDKAALRLHPGDPSTLDVDLDDDGDAEGGFPRSTFASIKIDMGGGADGFRIDETNGVFTDAEVTQILGGEGNDALTGGSATEAIEGGGGDDVIAGGPGFDQVRGGPGNDKFHWTPLDGEGLVEGGEGADTVFVDGSGAAEAFSVDQFPAPADQDIRIGYVSSGRSAGDSEQRLRGVERLHLDASAGDDRITASPDVGRLIALDITAGPDADGSGPIELTGDDDVVVGSDYADLIRGGVGSDDLDGRGGDDALHGGDGNDTLTGGAGFDSLTGAAGADVFGCDQPGEALDPAANDVVPALCTPAPATSSTGATAPATPGAASAPAAGALPAGFLGFAKPRVRPTRKGLLVTLVNLHTAAIDVKLAVREPFKKGDRRVAARYRAVRAHLAPGARATLKLRAPAALRRYIASRLNRDGRVVRRPTVTATNVATGGLRRLRPRLTLVAR